MNSEYLAGFFDGEGSFQIRIRKDTRYKTGFQVALRVDITQKNKEILDAIRNFVNAGNVYFNNTYEIYQWNVFKNSEIKKFISLIKGKVLVKKRELELFEKCAEIISQKKHVNQEGLDEIRKIKSTFHPQNWG